MTIWVTTGRAQPVRFTLARKLSYHHNILKRFCKESSGAEYTTNALKAFAYGM